MIIVRNTFVARPGQAGKLAKLMKEATAGAPLTNVRVMTDVAGDFNSVIMEHEVKNLGDFEGTMHHYMTDPTLREKMKGYTDLWVTGRREIFQVV